MKMDTFGEDCPYCGKYIWGPSDDAFSARSAAHIRKCHPGVQAEFDAAREASNKAPKEYVGEAPDLFYEIETMREWGAQR